MQRKLGVSLLFENRDVKQSVKTQLKSQKDKGSQDTYQEQYP